MQKSYTTGASTRRTTDLKMPVKTDGTPDKRYNLPQFCNKDGSKDMRTTPTQNKIKK